MEFKLLEETPVKKNIEITLKPEEVDAAIAAAVELARGSAQLDGYRKGKAPSSVIEKRFHDSIYNEAKENLINVNLNEIVQNLDVEIVGPIRMKGDDRQLEKGREFVYSMEFETMPKFEIPVYEGLEVEQEKAVINDDELQHVFKRFLEDHATLAPVEGSAPAKDGQIANLDFEAFDDGKAVKDFKAVNFDFELGANAALPDFETIVKGIPAGNTGEGTVHFPDDFFVKDLAGRDLVMKVTVHGVKEKRVPELDDAFAQKIGMKDAETVKDLITKSYIYSAEKLNKGVAENKLLEQLLKQVDFELPRGMVATQTQLLLGDKAERLERQGKSLEDTGKKLDELMAELTPMAEDFTRSRILLLAIAKKEKLEVSPEEVQKAVYENAVRKGEDFKETMEKLERSGLIFQLRDHLLSDKAMDVIYAKANVKMVDPKEPEAEAASGEKTETADQKEKD